MSGVLECENLSVRYAGNVALSDIAVSVAAGIGAQQAQFGDHVAARRPPRWAMASRRSAFRCGPTMGSST